MFLFRKTFILLKYLKVVVLRIQDKKIQDYFEELVELESSKHFLEEAIQNGDLILEEEKALAMYEARQLMLNNDVLDGMFNEIYKEHEEKNKKHLSRLKSLDNHLLLHYKKCKSRTGLNWNEFTKFVPHLSL